MTTNFLGIPVAGDITRGDKRAPQKPLSELEPLMRAVAGLPAETTHVDQSSGGADCIHVCHAARTFGAEPAGNLSAKTLMFGAVYVRNLKEVTTPKLPPPPPRSAQ